MTVITPGMLSSNRGDWETPPEIFLPLDAEFHFSLDVCATPATAKCPRFFTPEDDGLSRSWVGEVCWLNPPYGKGVERWLEKAHMHARWDGVTTVALLPARTDTKWFHTWCIDQEIRFLRGRVKFLLDGVRGQGNPFPSVVVIFRGRS